MHGAISILNAIGTGYGSAVGISLKVIAHVSLSNGRGIKVRTEIGKELLEDLALTILPIDIVSQNQINISIISEIPPGYGLKSSSAVTSALSLACFKITSDNLDDKYVLESAVAAFSQSWCDFYRSV